MVHLRRGACRELAALILLIAFVSYSATAAIAAPSCVAPQSVASFVQPIPSLSKAFKANNPIRIVAFGSSSTEGRGASSRDKAYPARLQAVLNAGFEEPRFEVVNRGRSGELATHMLARIERDVLQLDPVLVIWQTGVNDAIRKVDPTAFRDTVEAGLALMRQRGIDVILLDQQFFPGSVKVAGYQTYLELLREIGAAHGVPVFRRYELMKHLVDSEQFSIDELLASDRFHMNDVTYDCLGSVLAGAISASLED